MSFAFLVSAQWLIYAFIGVYAYSVSSRGDYSFYDLGVGDVYTDSLFAHILASISLFLGSFLAAKIFRLKTLSSKNIVLAFTRFRWNGVATIFNVLLSVLVLSLSFYTYGVDGLFYRAYYLPQPDAASVAAQILGFLVVFLACILLLSNNRRDRRFAIFSAIFIFFIFFAKGSRVSAFVLLSFGLSWIWFSSERSRFYMKISLSVLLLIMSMSLMGVLLYFRTQADYGLVPYFLNFFDAVNYLWVDDYQGWLDILFNISFSVPVTQFTILSAGNDVSELIIALTPVGGGASGWVQLADSRRISIDIPFSAFGELYAHSKFHLFGYMIVVGVLFAFFEDYVGRDVGVMVVLCGVVFFVFVVMFSLLAPQYNLRSTTRVIWYSVGLFAVAGFVRHYFPRLR